MKAGSPALPAVGSNKTSAEITGLPAASRTTPLMLPRTGVVCVGAGREAETWLLRYQARRMAARAERWLDTRDEWAADWQAAADSSDWLPRLTPAALRQLADDVHRLVEAAAAGSAGDPEARPVLVHLQAHPYRPGTDDPA